MWGQDLVSRNDTWFGPVLHSCREAILVSGESCRHPIEGKNTLPKTKNCAGVYPMKMSHLPGQSMIVQTGEP